MKIKIINGPNLNLLGLRNNQIYGKENYDDMINLIVDYCKAKNIEVSFLQTNHEGKIIDEIHELIMSDYDGLIINPGAYTHYSIAIRDALEIITLKKVEVHISDIYNRESFRKNNVIKDVVDYSIVGKGVKGYLDAINYLLKDRQM